MLRFFKDDDPMSRRTLLKIVAFICGLYFFLEFVLPEKIGGDFDCDSVHSPVQVQTPDGPVILYVGQYNGREASLGRLVADKTADASGWRRDPAIPVMQRTLFVPYEKNGMRQLDAVTNSTGIDLFYLGLDKRQESTLCHASGDPSGKHWKRTGAVLFSTNGLPRPTADEPNGELPGTIAFFAVGRDSTRWLSLLAFDKAGVIEVWSAEGESLSAMKLSPTPLIQAKQIPPNVKGFDGEFADGRWTIDFVTDAGITRLAQQPDGTFAAMPTQVLEIGDALITGLRTESGGGSVVFACRRSVTNAAGQQISTTELMSLANAGGSPLAAPQTVKSVGKAGQPTYLSLGTQTAANYVQIIGSFAIFIALINLTMFHGKRIIRLQKGSVHSTIFFIFTIAMAVLAYIGQPDAAANTNWRRGFDFIFTGVLTPMGTAVFSMITFYMISAAYRSFRVRSLEAALLMIAACVVMIGQMPIGAWLGSFLPDSLACLRLPWLAEKLLWLANACAYRGVLIGIAVGGFSIGLRIWLGLDNTVYSGLEEKK